MMIAAVTSANQPAAAAKPAAIPAAPKWPEPHSPGLTGAVLGLKATELAFTSDDTRFETGADFWDMLATAIEGEARGNPREARADNPGS